LIRRREHPDTTGSEMIESAGASQRVRGGFNLVRVAIGVIFTIGPPLAPALSWSHRVFFAGFAALGGVTAALAFRGVGDRWRPLVSGVIDVAVITLLVHEYGSVTTPLSALYLLPVPVMFNIMAHDPVVPRTLGALGVLSYLGVVAIEVAGCVEYAPQAAVRVRPEVLQMLGYVGFIGVLVLLVALLAGRVMIDLRSERRRSEALLLNVLPRVAVERLRSGETTIADGVPEATVLFADIVGFTPLASDLPRSAWWPCSTTCSGRSTNSRISMAWRRSRPSVTRTWSLPVSRSLARITAGRWLRWRWTCAKRPRDCQVPAAARSNCASGSTPAR
jgi:hypothetical protein